MGRPLSVTRPALVTAEELDRIEAAAYRILAGIGIRVGDDAPRERLGKAGFRVTGNRVFIEPAQAKAFVAETRGKEAGPEKSEPVGEFQLHVSPYPPFLHDSRTDSIEPFRMASLADSVKLLDTLADRGVCASPC